MAKEFWKIAVRRDISVELKALVAATEPLGREALITHAEINKLTKFDRHSCVWGRLIKKWKTEMLRRTGIVWVSSSGVGYRALSIEEQATTHVDKLHNQARRRNKEAASALGSIPPEQVPEQLQAIVTTGMQQCTQLEEVHKTQVAIRALWYKKTETIAQMKPAPITPVGVPPDLLKPREEKPNGG